MIDAERWWNHQTQTKDLQMIPATLDSLEQAFVHARRRAEIALSRMQSGDEEIVRGELDILLKLNQELVRRIRESDQQIAKVTEALRRV